MATYLLAMRPLGPAVFRAPGDATAAAHGPAVGSPGLQQPPPSSIAGTLASIALRQGLCSLEELRDCRAEALGLDPGECSRQGVADDFCNIHLCLRRLLGENYRLYTGLAVAEERLLVYTARGYLPPESLHCLARRDEDKSKCAVPTCRERGDGRHRGSNDGCRRLLETALRPTTLARTGVALAPASKTAREGLLYTQPETSLQADAAYAAIAVAGSQLRLPRFAKLGAENRMAALHAEPLNEEPWRLLLYGSQRCRRWLLVLASPALLDDTPWSNTATLAREPAEELAAMLLGGGLEYRLLGLDVAKAVPGLEVVAPGWCTPRNSPRRPMLHVPAGTAMVLEASYDTVRTIVERGAGLNTRQGWGTVAAACIDTEEQQ